MVQTRKPETHARVLAAAEQAFAEAGYEGATVADIAARAGVSTGNVYRYFENKDALFYEVLPDAFAVTFLRLVQRRVRALARADDLTALDASARGKAEELLRFWVEHRRQVIILLDRSKGSRHEAFAERFVSALMRPTLAKFRADTGTRLSGAARFVLEQIFRNTVRTIVSILEAHEDEASIRNAFQGFWSYQLAGLAGFSKWVAT
ncbi:TetR/AcrR family transcriptional regulator [Hyalangium rubrum]|uniref:Helix-turn-helix domain-containing protein n=1 Tax=Hyalangium rubrum TaxID=3103134 RepID=A0ABU5HJX3_9BACT|nr:helix-turn-helix domain-containing protein [Hyalangium sp. s54d21]MDY7233143.1 helix-turn-helix domain-containing protein [Hyalangium sp. s54d21]